MSKHMVVMARTSGIPKNSLREITMIGRSEIRHLCERHAYSSKPTSQPNVSIISKGIGVMERKGFCLKQKPMKEKLKYVSRKK